MSGFSADWLALREPVDHASRSIPLAGRLQRAMLDRPGWPLRIVDLGCGTGSNLRATAASLASAQHWTLVDNDPRLLRVARERLLAWADTGRESAAGLALEAGGRHITVSFRQADLAADLERVLAAPLDLVTCSALLDLCSPAFIERAARAVASAGAVFHTTLTYDGVQAWQPIHPADEAMRAAFVAHQQTDKGFGAAAGPAAPGLIRAAFEALGYRVAEGESPWRLGPKDMTLIGELARGFAGAVEETGRVPTEALASWRTLERTGAVVGHVDTLALPPR
jgi:SAM-dependent methyltransferase